MNFQDKTLRCRDCGDEFMFTVGEQEWFASKNFVNEPTRCQACRAANRVRQAAVSGATEAPIIRALHPVTCAQCGYPARVPFLPRLDRPVYCSTCFDHVRAARPQIAQ